MPAIAFHLRPARLEDALPLQETCWPERDFKACLSFLDACQQRWVTSGRGAMIDYLSAEAVRLKMRQLEIGAAERNPRAKALYERLGFVQQRRIEINLGAGLESVDYLVKPL